jgi:hypothetical protein
MSDRLFERAVTDWLEDGSDRTPPAAIDAVLLAVKTTPQARRGPLAPWRFTQMNLFARAAAVLVVAVVAIGALVLLAGPKGSVGGPSASDVPSPSPAGPQGTTPPPTEAASGTSVQAACPAPASVSLTSSSRSLQVAGPIDSTVRANVLQAGFGAVWAATQSGLMKLSVPGASPTTVLANPIYDVALSSTSVFALSNGTGELLEIDPASLKVVNRWAIEPGAHSLAAGPDAAYVDYQGSPPRLVRYDAKTKATLSVDVADMTSSTSGREIAVDGSSVWMTDGRRLVRLDPTNLSSHGLTALPFGIDDLWLGDGALWAASTAQYGGVVRIDPQTGCSTLQAQSDAIQIAFSPHGVWLAAAGGIIALDPVSAQKVAELPTTDVLGNDAAGIAVVGDEVWTSYLGSGLQRIKTGEAK